jgi:hypothetical protein
MRQRIRAVMFGCLITIASLSAAAFRQQSRPATEPLADEFTVYLKVEPNADGSMRAFLRNPERNIGRFTRIAALERDGDIVRLLAASANRTKGQVLGRRALPAA